MLKESYALVEACRALEQSVRWDRLLRIFYIWSKAVREQNTHEHLHQFCHCIEGLILPDVDKAERQFIPRESCWNNGAC